jgi:inner membrane protein involved in colicin E2 resistance
MTVASARTLWKAAAVAVVSAILILIATRDWLYALLMCGIVFLGFWLYEVMYPKKLGQ